MFLKSPDLVGSGKFGCPVLSGQETHMASPVEPYFHGPLTFYLIRSPTYFEVAATKPKTSKEEHRFILFRWIIWRNYYTAALMVMSQRSKVLFIKEEKNVCALQLGGHSITTWAKSYPILTLHLLEWTKMDILHSIYSVTWPPVDFLLSPTPLFLST